MKDTINLFGREYPLTAEWRRRITKSLVEAQGKLAKQLEYPEDLRNYELIELYANSVYRLTQILA
jgi:hypothetical protein